VCLVCRFNPFPRLAIGGRIPDLVAKTKALKVTGGAEPGADLGPMISPAAKERAENIIAQGIAKGATIALDGRGVVVKGYEKGNFLGPTILCGVNPGNPAYDEEIFGPVCPCFVCITQVFFLWANCCVCVVQVLSITFVDTLDDAIKMINANPYGNGTAIFTQSGAAARKFQHEIDVGQVRCGVTCAQSLPWLHIIAAIDRSSCRLALTCPFQCRCPCSRSRAHVAAFKAMPTSTARAACTFTRK
jgi:malonate-semialdehyde dehydrogenase (acetylating) / methylmalonate-semialdehyde dehydrogenase